MVGMGMIFDETYRPVFESLHRRGFFDPEIDEAFAVELSAVASRTGHRAEAYRKSAGDRIGPFASYYGPDAVAELSSASRERRRRRLPPASISFCVATPDDRHFAAARAVLSAEKHLLVEKPSVLSLAELDELNQLARQNGVLAKVVYHKLLDPDHKRMRTLVADGELQHVNHGYCSLLEPKAIGTGQFAEWIRGPESGHVRRRALHQVDRLHVRRPVEERCLHGQRGIVGPADGTTWDSSQLRLVYDYDDGREAAFDIHTIGSCPTISLAMSSRRCNSDSTMACGTAHGRRRGVECTIEGRTPQVRKITPNHHYNAEVLEPWGERAMRGYGLETIERFIREVARVEFGGSPVDRPRRLEAARSLAYNDLSADRQAVAAVQAMEAILSRRAAGVPDAVVHVNHPAGGLVLFSPGRSAGEVLYAKPV